MKSWGYDIHSFEAFNMNFGYFVQDFALTLTSLFFGPFEKNSRMRKLKTQEKNSKLKQKTQGFGKYSIFVFLTPPKID